VRITDPLAVDVRKLNFAQNWERLSKRRTNAAFGWSLLWMHRFFLESSLNLCIKKQTNLLPYLLPPFEPPNPQSPIKNQKWIDLE